MPVHSCAFTVPASLQDALNNCSIAWYSPLTDDPRWLNTRDLTGVPTWERITADYQRACGFPHLAPAAACGLQHYAGRFVGVMLTVWASSALVLSHRHDDWLAFIDEDGATQVVSCPDLPVAGQGSARTAAEAIVDHLTPVVEACRGAVPLTAKVAWGCIAASCAGVFGRIYQGASRRDRPNVLLAAEHVLRLVEAQVGRQLVSWHVHHNPPGLTHDRATCCLMRLGTHKDACGTCPDISAEERRTRQRRSVVSPQPALPISWSVAS